MLLKRQTYQKGRLFKTKASAAAAGLFMLTDIHLLQMIAFAAFSLSLSLSFSPALLRKNSHFTHTHTHTHRLCSLLAFNANIIYRFTRPLRVLSRSLSFCFSSTYLTLVEHLSVFNYRFTRPFCRSFVRSFITRECTSTMNLPLRLRCEVL